ncbi:unnamed protein product [Ostreobium quekettii]|uniref:Uncharacterized protein n=1 Tax=Ostreobium quekettii TaxID=121088 RepID=A0A8S1IWG5_9CHLO|nr:unnamed protein product [Ostreobium quekettii]
MTTLGPNLWVFFYCWDLRLISWREESAVIWGVVRWWWDRGSCGRLLRCAERLLWMGRVVEREEGMLCRYCGTKGAGGFTSDGTNPDECGNGEHSRQKLGIGCG